MFSEYTAMVMVAKYERIEQTPNSVQSKFARSSESKDYLAKIMPFSGSVNKYRKAKLKQDKLMQSLTAAEQKEFSVPVHIFKDNFKGMRKTKPTVKDRILLAVGLDLDCKESGVSWEQYLEISQMLNILCTDKVQQRWFCVKLFDPKLQGLVLSEEFELLVK